MTSDLRHETGNVGHLYVDPHCYRIVAILPNALLTKMFSLTAHTRAPSCVRTHTARPLTAARASASVPRSSNTSRRQVRCDDHALLQLSISSCSQCFTHVHLTTHCFSHSVVVLPWLRSLLQRMITRYKGEGKANDMQDDMNRSAKDIQVCLSSSKHARFLPIG